MKLVTTSLTEAVRTIQSPRRGRVQPFKAPPRLREGWFVADVGQRKGDEGVGRAHLPAAPKSAESPPKKGAGSSLSCHCESVLFCTLYKPRKL